MAVLGLAVLTPRSGADAQEADTLPHPELVVRALRTPVPADALPYAVTVRRPAVGAPSAGVSLGSQLRAVPGLQVQSRYNEALGDRIVMRGFGARSQFGVRGLQILVDGIPATMPDGQATLNHLDLSLLDRAEVLRGPAAAAYGNAAGGVLLLSTRAPPAADFRQEVGVAAGGGGLLRARTITGGGRGAMGWSTAVMGERRDGFRPHAGTERYQLTGRAEAPLAGGFVRAVAHGVSYDADNPGSLTLEQYREAPHQAQPFNVAQGTGERGRHGQLGLVWERSLGGAVLESMAYGLARSLENPIPPTIIHLDRRAGGARVLIRSAGADDAGPSWAFGADAAIQGDDRQNFENLRGARGARTLDQVERVTNVAVHGQAMLPLLEPLRLFLGARYDRVSFSATDRFIRPDNPDDSGSRTMAALSPTTGLRLQLSPVMTLFGNMATAFETPTTTELVNRPEGSGGFNQELDPQRTVSYELGARTTPWSALRVQASLYHARVTGALIPFEVATSPGRQFFRNAGAAVHQGVEVLIEVTAPRVDLMGAFSWTAVEFSSHSSGDRVFDGNAVPGVRPWTVELVARTAPTRGMIVELDYQGTGAMAVDDANEAWAPGYSVVVPNAFGGRFFEPGPSRSLYLGMDVAVPMERVGGS